MKISTLIIPCVGAIVAACAGSQTPTETPDSEAQAAGTEALAWKDMDRDQRMEFMGLTVLPEMKKLFQEADPEGYKDFKCQTCHGENMQEVDYKLPNGLFALEKPDPIPASKEYDEEVTAFMMDKVVPRMAELMQMEPVKEFGCFNCHEAETSE